MLQLLELVGPFGWNNVKLTSSQTTVYNCPRITIVAGLLIYYCFWVCFLLYLHWCLGLIPVLLCYWLITDTFFYEIFPWLEWEISCSMNPICLSSGKSRLFLKLNASEGRFIQRIITESMSFYNNKQCNFLGIFVCLDFVEF